MSGREGLRRRRIFIGPTEIAGIGAGLAHGFAALGHAPALWLSIPHPFAYGEEHRPPSIVQLWQAIGRRRQSTPRERVLAKVSVVLLHRLVAWAVLALALARFDSFIFLFGQTITDSVLELRLMRLLRRRIIFIYAGSDARPPYMDGAWCGPDGRLPAPDKLARMARRTRARVNRHERFADFCVNAPGTAHFHAQRCINWFAMGLPRQLPAPVAGEDRSSGAVRILHSPSNPIVKGTAVIQAAVAKLQARGLAIDFVLIEKMPNHEVLRELARCDFIVDQLHSDTPMAGFATEAAFFGKPAVVAGHFAARMPAALGTAPVPPSLYTTPDRLIESIERLATDPAFRLELGAKARDFVTAQWSTQAVASRYLRLLDGDVPAGWWLDPSTTDYLLGCGVSEAEVRRSVAALIAAHGSEALQLSDKPALEQAFRKLAREDAPCCDTSSPPA